MYDSYSFVLEWDELDEDLRNEKIDKYLEDNGCEYSEGTLAYEEARRNAEKNIQARFPMYF